MLSLKKNINFKDSCYVESRVWKVQDAWAGILSLYMNNKSIVLGARRENILLPKIYSYHIMIVLYRLCSY